MEVSRQKWKRDECTRRVKRIEKTVVENWDRNERNNRGEKSYH